MGNNKTLAEKLYEWMLRFEGKKENMNFTTIATQ